MIALINSFPCQFIFIFLSFNHYCLYKTDPSPSTNEININYLGNKQSQDLLSKSWKFNYLYLNYIVRTNRIKARERRKGLTSKKVMWALYDNVSHFFITHSMEDGGKFKCLSCLFLEITFIFLCSFYNLSGVWLHQDKK